MTEDDINFEVWINGSWEAGTLYYQTADDIVNALFEKWSKEKRLGDTTIEIRKPGNGGTGQTIYSVTVAGG